MSRNTPAGHTVRPATPADVDGARSVMLDTFYKEFGYGYVPDWHRDVTDLKGTYLDDPRHTLLVAVHDGEVVATTAVHSRGPAHPPHPRWLAERYPSGTTAQLVRVYVRPEHRRRGLARTLVNGARDFVAGTPATTASICTPTWTSRARRRSGAAWPRRSSTPAPPASTARGGHGPLRDSALTGQVLTCHAGTWDTASAAAACGADAWTAVSSRA
ncbi:hypothetical protein SHKM778_25410 [Streptomyces sp. KM77-8]|uniref:N-acetyltransferase domain-containing protein n=1 Tax=Streptomyces haneummycinicus TaxID=3074435 RepID=A0AAT9HFP9_9ACTN